jgi:hypothetical protein
MRVDLNNNKTCPSSSNYEKRRLISQIEHYSVFLLLFSFCQLCFTISQLIFPFILLVKDDLYCSFNLVVGRKILWYFKLKILRGL